MIGLRNVDYEMTEGVTGDGTNKTITHQLGVIPTAVLVTPKVTAKTACLISKSATSVVVNGENTSTFDVLIIK